MDVIGDLVGESPAVAAVREQVARLLARQAGSRPLPPILIQGETGTGKGLLARLIHRAGPRAGAPFVDVNCAAIPETMLEAEMFGFERGAFTDARQAKAGLFQAAHHGTIFLDEIGLLPEGLQAKLLKVIEERMLRRLGSTRSEPIDVAVIAASNEDLAAAARARRFREDLFHRLAVLTLWLPPLRERGRDVVLLAERFLARACADYDLPPKTFDRGAQAALLAHPWPGNIRELGNVIERVALLADGLVVTAAMLGLGGGSGAPPAAGPAAPPAAPAPLEQVVGSAEREHLREALEGTGWNISRAAALLGVSRNTLRYRIEKHGLRPGAPAPPVVRGRAPRAPAPPPAPPEAPAPPRVRWDRRRVTLLRATLVAAAPGGPLYASRSTEALVEKVRSFGGRVEELSPIGVVAAFGLDPLEDAPRHAAHAAMAIQKAVERARPDGAEPHVKIGIHVGQFMVGEGGGSPQIDLDAKREAGSVLEALLAAGPPDTVLATEAAASFLERGFEMEPLPVPAGGAAAYRLTGRRRRALGRPLAPFVGRRHDLDLLHSRLASTQAGRGQLVGVVGEAGLGKSRLVYEFRRSLRQRSVTWLEGRCLSYGASMPYLPLLQMLRQGLGLAEDSAPAVVAARVRAALGALGLDPAEWTPYLLQLLGASEGAERPAALNPDAVKARTLEALRQLCLRGSRQRPIVFVLEDLHWIDRTSEEWLSALVGSLAGTSIMLLATYRPGYRPGWMDKSYATQIALQPLSEEDSRSVMRAALRDETLPDPLARLILDKAEGNPFFLEELAGAVREQGELPAPALAVPDTIQELLLARMHRLPPGPKQALQTAAVLGREASLDLLRALWAGDDGLPRHLAELVRLEFLWERGRGSETVYVFKHPLTQEVAYQSVEPERRRALHAVAGRALEAMHADRLRESCEPIAEHYARSDEAGKALEYLVLVARKAAGLNAHDEAVRALEEAQRHLEGVPAAERERRRLDLVLFQASELMPLGRLQEIVTLLRPFEERVAGLGDPALAGRYYFVLCHTYSFLDRDMAARYAERAIAEADRCGDTVIRGKAHCIIGQDGPLAGRALDGIAHGRTAIALLAGCEEQWWLGRAHWVVALNHTQVGAFAEALAALGQAEAIAQATGDRRLQVCTAWSAGIVHAARGETATGVRACRRALELSPDLVNRAIASGWLGFALAEHGEAREAVSRLEEAVAAFTRIGYRPLQAWFAAFLAEAYRRDGRLDRARGVAESSLGLAGEARVSVAAGWARHVLGRIARDQGALDEAERQLRAALAIFTEIHSRYETARTQLDLAGVLRARGDGVAAAQMLAAARQLFTVLDLPAHVSRAT
jgi:DNA-binding NtrC family response regulator